MPKIVPLTEGCRYNLENGGAVEVVPLLVDDEEVIGVYFLNTEKRETYLCLSQEAAEALISGLMYAFEGKGYNDLDSNGTTC